jgi:hypothetical protein
MSFVIFLLKREIIKLYDGFPRFFSLAEKRQNDHRPSLTKNFYWFSCIKAKHKG